MNAEDFATHLHRLRACGEAYRWAHVVRKAIPWAVVKAALEGK